jgi:membrane-bound lytic murein transglycosylase A
MQAGGARAIIGLGLGLCLIAGAAAQADDTLKFRNAQVETLNFTALDGWKNDDHVAAFGAFMKSCAAILQGSKAMRAARPLYGALFKACERGAAAGKPDETQARLFFEDNFNPVRVAPPGQGEGFFTGYYETEVDGSRFPSDEYKVPMYAAPAETVRKKASTVFGHLDRSAIEDGAIAGKGLEICYVKNPVDAFFTQIQGSARIKLDSGRMMRLNYVASNGQRYYPVGKDLIDRGIVTKEEMSMDKIRDWMEANPQEGRDLRRKNRSFVFFTETSLGENDECIGAQGIPLTPGRSLAVDKKIHIYGTPIWVDAELPIASEKPDTKFQRLLVAQDTGSAIVGPARADIYFGHGEEISHVAGRIKQYGKFVMLVPRSVAVKASIPIPLPAPLPKDIEPAVTSSISAREATALPQAAPQPKPNP